MKDYQPATPPVCIRREGSLWTLCECPDCRKDQRRQAKLTRNGYRPLDQRPAAVTKLRAWLAAGYSVGTITTISGAHHTTIARHAAGLSSTVSHATAARIMDAPEWPPDDTAGFVSSLGVWRRLRALTVMGWSMADLAARCELKESTLHALRDPKHKETRPRYARVVRDLYEELSMRHGPCRYAATRARRKGWAPPLAWVEGTIDDPDARPVGDVRGPEHLRVDDIAEWLERNPFGTSQQCADRFSLTRDAVTQACRRAGRRDLVERFARNAQVAA